MVLVKMTNYVNFFRVIFGYMGLTHTLDVKDQGYRFRSISWYVLCLSGHDLDQFLNNFSSGKVLYGFVRVDVVTPAKFVLIVWVSFSVPLIYIFWLGCCCLVLYSEM